MSLWFRDHLRALGEASRHLSRGGLSTALAILTIGVALALPASGLWLLNAAEELGRPLGQTHEVTVFLDPEADAADAQEIKRRIERQQPKQLRFIDKETALADMSQQEGLKGLTAGLTRNPLPDAFIVTPQDASPSVIKEFAQHARTWPKVMTVQHDDAWAMRYQSAIRLGHLGVNLLAALLGIALVAVTYNTIRLQIYAQQAETDVALMIGATRHWVARPFLWLGIIEGTLGALLALVIVLAVFFLLAPLASDLAKTYGSDWRLPLPNGQLIVSVLLTGAGLGALGALLSSRRLGHPTRS